MEDLGALGRVYRRHHPKAVEVVDTHREQEAHKKDIEYREGGHTSVHKVQYRKQRGVSHEGNDRTRIGISKPLVHEHPARQLLSRGLNQHADKEDQRGQDQTDHLGEIMRGFGKIGILLCAVMLTGMVVSCSQVEHINAEVVY